jgi:hypothetical protein
MHSLGVQQKVLLYNLPTLRCQYVGSVAGDSFRGLQLQLKGEGPHNRRCYESQANSQTQGHPRTRDHAHALCTSKRSGPSRLQHQIAWLSLEQPQRATAGCLYLIAGGYLSYACSVMHRSSGGRRRGVLAGQSHLST